MIKVTSRPPKRRKIFIIIAALLGVAAITIAILELTDTTYIFHDKKAVPGIIPSTSQESPVDEKEKNQDNKEKDVVPSTGANTAPENPKQGDDSAAKPSGAAPLSPYGNFISNHSPNLGGNPAPSSVQSVCNTSPGAQCHIEFTNQDGVKKTLAAQTTDSNGATYWNWDVKQAGFTVGSWKIKVIATLNGQTATADAAQNLEIKP